MRIRGYIETGPHIIKPERLPDQAFGVTVLNLETDPNIELPVSMLYTGHIPPELAAVIRHFSVHERIVSRHRGTYYHMDAEATVKHDSGGMSMVEANGKNLTNVVELCDLIRRGDITPIIPDRDQQVERTVVNVKEAWHQLIDAIALAVDQWVLRLSK